jgi:hypothetical protein
MMCCYQVSPCSQSLSRDNISTCSEVELHQRSSITLPHKEKADSEEILDTRIIIISLAKIDNIGYVLL